jgi:hypothetical protein
MNQILGTEIVEASAARKRSLGLRGRFIALFTEAAVTDVLLIILK